MARSRVPTRNTTDTAGTAGMAGGAPMPGDSDSVTNSATSDGAPMTNEVNGDEVTGDSIVYASEAPTDEMTGDETQTDSSGEPAVAYDETQVDSTDETQTQTQDAEATQTYTLKKSVNYQGTTKSEGDEVELTDSQADQLKKSGHI